MANVWHYTIQWLWFTTNIYVYIFILYGYIQHLCFSLFTSLVYIEHLCFYIVHTYNYMQHFEQLESVVKYRLWIITLEHTTFTLRCVLCSRCGTSL
jgi:hypothetical protein